MSDVENIQEQLQLLRQDFDARMAPSDDWRPSREVLSTLWHETERGFWKEIATKRPEFGRLQQVDGRDSYILTINTDVVTGLTWADLSRWSLVQDKHNQQFPEHALAWEPGHKLSFAERRLRLKTRRRLSSGGYDVDAGDAGEDEWSAIRLGLLNNIEHVRFEASTSPVERAIVSIRDSLRNAPNIPEADRLIWRDKRRGQAARYIISSDTAVAVCADAGCDVSRNDVLGVLRGLGGRSEAVHIPAPYNRNVRVYTLTERQITR